MVRQNKDKSKFLKKFIQSSLACSQNNLSLFLDYNIISEDVAEILEKQLKNFTDLQMSLKSCYLGNICFTTLVSGIANCTNLKSMKLDLYNNQIQAEGAYQLSLAIQNFENIETIQIDLRRNNIRHQGLFKLASSFQNCQYLSTLILGLKSNNISGKDTIKSFTALAQSKTLKTLALNLSKNNINASCAIDICSELVKNTTIQNLKIDFSKNFISNLGLIGSCQHLFNSTYIQSLVLRLCNAIITDDGLLCLKNTLIQGKIIPSLAIDFQGNNLSEQSVSEFISCIGSTQIQVFKLNINEVPINLEQSCLGFDKSQFANLINLDICFEFNNPKESQLQLLGAVIANLPKLSILRLVIKRWDQENYFPLFDGIARCKNIKTFLIYAFPYYQYFRVANVEKKIYKKLRKIKSLVHKQILYKNLTEETFAL
ncbi:kinase domain protein (macronuclear) [Tetrahymena thermophila SB210]|uniref:Kinase domain protein n=1 Tax=Tetrahymena thermophila (strain SB210) TaxID=312017 RepID=W7XKA8_TETTS|nr:kinase domain protein [Tetrahymena thermophila SB210]EWS74764.1 kinase domain protein [Tetrahymena thermophila SB210]|eukprot:XP_012652765.1 kinase domain protein [Tetrahymena thermophila SB210]